MKKSIILLIAVLTITACYAQRGSKAAQMLFDSTTIYIKEQGCCQIQAHYTRYFDFNHAPYDERTETIIALNNEKLKKTMCFTNSAQDQIILRNAQKMVMVDNDRKAYYTFKQSRRGSSEYVSQEDHLMTSTLTMVPCFAPWMKTFRSTIINTPNFFAVGDTNIDGMDYRVIYGEETAVHHYSLTYYVNPQTHLIERLEKNIIDSADAHKMETKWIISYTIMNQDITDSIAELFDKVNPQYSDYEFSDDTGIPLCNQPLIVGEPIVEELLDFPLQNLNGSVTSLRDQQGYILLDIFHNHCAPCIKFMEEQAAERMATGTTRLEKSGIKLMSINTLSRSIDLTKRIVPKGVDHEYVFLAFGMEKYLMVLGYPMFILLSPDKRVLCVTDRSEAQYIDKIIDAKKNNE